ncbi:MAG TPA: 2-oxo acid dehydrogenase subunit E2, partial [Cellvibrio sp.]|nr:2-oxo acid dehydrogenase subunit E2 [Cellvibrio sp.]
MSIEIKAPTFPESVADGTVATWHKKPGEAVKRDELIVDIETDKVVLEVVAPADGSIAEILKGEGETVLSNEVIARFVEGAAVASAPAAAAAAPAVSAPQAAAEKPVNPAARKLAEENNVSTASVAGSGRDGRVLKEDVANHLKSAPAASAPAAPAAGSPAAPIEAVGDRVEKRVPMTRLRKRIAERLLEASSTTAMLTTFNEVNMAPVMALRAKYKDQFEKAHGGSRLGFMSFFVKAAAEALRRFPVVNASIDNNDVVYHGYQDIGVAVSTEKGLVVPVLRNAENMSLATIENT